MNCPQARARISAYLDHELDATSSREVESHIQQCAACREVLSDFKEIDAAVHGLPRIEPGPDFPAQVVTRVREPAATGEVKRHSGLSLLERMTRIAEDFMALVDSAQCPSTGTLDEFRDFPPLSMGHVYFKLMDLPARRG